VPAAREISGRYPERYHALDKVLPAIAAVYGP
jgi:hypothetical protein